MVAAFVVSEVRGVVPPTAPVKVIVPAVPPLIVKAEAPFKVLEKLIDAPVAVPPALVLSIVVVPVTVTGPVNPMVPPLVVILPLMLMAVGPV